MTVGIVVIVAVTFFLLLFVVRETASRALILIGAILAVGLLWASHNGDPTVTNLDLQSKLSRVSQFIQELPTHLGVQKETIS